MKSVRPGLSLVEVLLAVLILGVSATTLLSLQGTLVRVVFSGHSLLERLGFVRSFFVSAEREMFFKKGSQKKIIEDPLLTMTYQTKQPVTQTLAREKHLIVEQVDAEWPTPFGTRQDLFARYLFSPKKEKSL